MSLSIQPAPEPAPQRVNNQPSAAASNAPASGSPAPTALAAMQRGAASAADRVERPAARVAFKGGPIQFTSTSFTVGGKEYPLANARAPQGFIAMAGTRGVPSSDGETPQGSFTVQGPAFGTPEAKSKQPGKIGKIAQRLLVRFLFGRSATWEQRLRLEAAPTIDYARISGAEIEAKIREWKMQPGDWILVGEHHAGHLVMYVGDDAKGRPQIIHSMATKYENRSLPQFVSGLGEGLVGIVTGRGIEKTGVFQEGVATYFDRHNRGTAIAQRDPGLTPEMRAHLVKLVRADVGKGYDGNLLESRDRIYCSELLMKNLIDTYKHFNKQPPEVQTIRVQAAKGWFFEMDAYVASPETVSVSPHFQTIGLAGFGEKDMIQNLTTFVRAER